MYSLVGANTSSFQSLRAQLFILIGDQVNAERELVDVRTLSAKIEDTWGVLVRVFLRVLTDAGRETHES
jgi:hypothetical protein